MKNIVLIILLLLFCSCTQNAKEYTTTILENGKIDTTFIQNISESEKALISLYLFAYGNECTDHSATNKCQLLDLLQIKDECDKQHIDFLNKWFKKDVLMSSKLQNCPNLPINFAIQNSIKKLVLSRVVDTLSLTIEVKGINETQEKTWDTEQTMSYFIKNDTFIKIHH